jgi:hypothetical protein
MNQQKTEMEIKNHSLLTDSISAVCLGLVFLVKNLARSDIDDL